MTKEEYMKALKDNLLSLTVDEQNEALQYYWDYFDDAGFDEASVLEKFGTPEELAATIKKDLSNTLVKTGKEEKQQGSSESKLNNDNSSMYFEFEKGSISNLSLDLGAVEAVCIPGEKFSVETRGIMAGNMYCNVENNDNLVIRNINKMQNFDFFSHARKKSFAPRILITVPAGVKLDNLFVHFGAGKFESRELGLTCGKAKIDTGAGNFILKGITTSGLDARCGMGNMEISGEIKGRSNLDCSMGQTILRIKGDPADYTYDSKVGLGSVEFNKDKQEGINKSWNQQAKENHVSINCGMGAVKVIFN